MCLAAGGVRGGRCRCMTVGTEGHRVHGMNMRMIIEIGAIAIVMAVQTGIACRMTGGNAGQQSGRIIMAGIAAVTMGLGHRGIRST